MRNQDGMIRMSSCLALLFGRDSKNGEANGQSYLVGCFLWPTTEISTQIQQVPETLNPKPYSSFGGKRLMAVEK